MKKVDRDPFSNGTEYMRFEELNCNHCWKSSRYKGETDAGEEYTKMICAIQRDIFTRMVSDKTPIAQRTIDICRTFHCPFKQEHRKRKPRKHDKYKDIPTLL